MALLTTAAVIAPLGGAPSRAQAPGSAQAQTRSFNIPPQPLASALTAFGDQADMQVTADTALVEGVQSPGVSGSLTSAEALSRLLTGTGLTFRWISAQSVMIERAPQASGGAISLGPVRVEGDGAGQGGAYIPPQAMIGNLPSSYSGGQVATGGQLGLLGNRDVMDTPFNQTNYTAKKAQDQQAITIRDVLVDDPSVRSFVPDGGSGSDQVYIRGFNVSNGNIAYGGLAGILPSVSVMAELAERIEVLKGPGVMLNGMPPATSIGGSVNVVPKRAPAEPLNQITVNFASAGQVGGHADVARRFGDRQSFGVRFNGAYRAGETGVQWNKDERGLAVIGADLRGESVRLAVDLGYQHQHVDGMKPYLGFANDVPVLTPPDAGKNVGQPWNYTDYEDTFGVVRVEADLADQVTAYAAFGAHRNEGRQFNAGPRVTVEDVFGNASSRPLIYNSYARHRTAEAGLRVKGDTGPISHELAATATTYRQTAGEGSVSSALVRTNIYAPVVLARPDVPMPVAVKVSTQRLSSFGLADTLSIADGRVQLTIGGRFQQVQAANFNPTTGAQTSSYDESAFSPAIALVVKPGDGVSVYANWIQGLQQGVIVRAGFANAGEVFPPYKSTQYEAGVKIDWGRFITTASVFQISQPSTLTDVPTNTMVLDGERRNRGLELNIAGEPISGLRLLGGVMLMDGVLTKTQDGATDGWTAPHSPTFSLNLGAEWDVPAIRGLTLTGRVVYTGKQYFDTMLPRRSLPDWTRYDLGARYKFENPLLSANPLTARLSVENVLDTNYWAGGTGATTLMLGAPRTFRLALTTNF